MLGDLHQNPCQGCSLFFMSPVRDEVYCDNCWLFFKPEISKLFRNLIDYTYRGYGDGELHWGFTGIANAIKNGDDRCGYMASMKFKSNEDAYKRGAFKGAQRMNEYLFKLLKSFMDEHSKRRHVLRTGVRLP